MPRKKIKMKTIEYNPASTVHGYRNVRWVENVSLGLRKVGFADEIRRLDHRGWFTYDDGDPYEVLRGIVFQLPSRDGETLYAYGYEDPCNDDCALLCFDCETDKDDAARAADRFAELVAEEERDYHRAWDAGRRCEQLDEEIKEMRSKALKLGAEMREARRVEIDAPTICATLREKVLSLYNSIQKARRKRDELIADFGKQPGFVE